MHFTNNIKRCTRLFIMALTFVVFFNGYKAQGPARTKFKHLGTSEEDLTVVQEIVPQENLIKTILNDRRLKSWESWWRKCVPDFSAKNMEDTGVGPIYDEDIPFLSSSQISDGPAKMFYLRAPSGNRYLNPYYGRLIFKKEQNGWQPYIELPCGAALYDLKEKRAKNILDCSALEGVDEAFWMDADKIAFLGYAAITRQMNVECQSVNGCITPSVWIVNLKNRTVNEHRGGLLPKGSCEAGAYLKQRLPKFFGE